MSGKNIIFDNKKDQQKQFLQNKKIFNIDDIDVNKLLVSKKEPYGKKGSFKYFIGYNDDDVNRPLCIKLPQMIGYVKRFYSIKTMPFKAIDDKLLKRHAKIWGESQPFNEHKI